MRWILPASIGAALAALVALRVADRAAGGTVFCRDMTVPGTGRETNPPSLRPPDTAAATATTTPAVDFTAAAARVDRWARVAPADAAAWAATLPEGEAKAQILAHAGVLWAEREPAAAAEFAAQLPPGPAREQMLTNVFHSWSGHDLLAATEWLAQTENDRACDAPLAVVATNSRLVFEFPRTALHLAEAIAAPERRAGTIGAIVELWSRRDATAARDYLRTTAALAPAQRIEFATKLDRLPPDDP